jgi:hypothetical protein
MFTRRHRLTSTLAGALALIAIAAPTAGALPAEQVQGSPSGPAPASPRYPTMESKAGAPAPTVTRTIDDGFDWGSIAIGAGGAAAALLLAAGGASAVSHHRHRIGVVR